ncbi:hypothetical protein Moror_2554 [Moniliophthora roreri MCA 2997]|uniref:Uncharacterized protein n=2 Tax=Moniliophthora roreri TaxID=221103 RepID=V2YIN0_MONRO|nr:hypothetical protein Moror_2554 [Moniliophthora roreri MCA 2997]KAI3619416.1 hypothetical protein WG66_013011 [Moniliophthora roreri]
MTNPLFPSTPQSRIPTPGHSRKMSMNATASSPASTPSSNTSGRNFRALRSLLPFAPNKNATPVSPSATLPFQHIGQNSGGGTAIKSPFASFGTVRRSMNLTREKEKGKGRDVERERKMSLSSALPVISIEHPSMTMEVATPIRKSMSLTTLEREKPLPDAPIDEMGQFRRASNDRTVTRSSVHSPDSELSSISGTRSGSSIQPWELENSTEDITSTVPATADLSTIIEADTSGISKHIPSTTHSSPSLPSSRFPSVSPANSPIHSKRSSPSDSPLLPVQQLPIRPSHPPKSNSSFMPSPSPSPFSPVSSDADVDTGNDSSHLELDFSTSQITSQVASAMNSAPGSWDDARVVDVDESFVLDQHEQEEDHTERRRIGTRQTGSLIINMDTVDPQLAALLSPHKIPPGRLPSPGLAGDEENNTIIIPKPIRASGSSSSSVLLPKENPKRPQQQSSLPRLRPKIFTANTSPADTGSSSSKHPSPVFQTNVFDSEAHTQNPQQGRDGLLGAGSASTSTLPMTASSSPASISPTASASAFTSTAKSPSSIASSSRTQRSASGSTTGRGHMRMLTSPSPSASTTTLDPAFVLRKDGRRQQRDRDRDRPHLGIGLGLPSGAGAASSPSGSPRLEGRGSFDSSPHLGMGLGTGTSSPRQFVNEHGGRGSLDESFSPRRPSPGPGFSASTPFNMRRQRRRSMSVDDRNTPMRERSGSAISSTRAYLAQTEERPGSSLSSGGRTDWLGPRTAKAFRAAGLLDGKESSPDTGSISGHLGMQRYGSLRGTRAPSRAAFSDAGLSASGRRRGSGSYFSLGGSGGSGSVQSPTDSPTMTVNSRERAPSTAPTSVSSHSHREREDELTAMKEKHATETSALLSALSDSQRTARVLRDENAELRERIQQLERISDLNERLAVENEQLREGLGELEEDNKRLRRVVGELKVQMRLGEMRLSGSLSAGSGVTGNGERRLYGSLGRHTGSPLRPRAESPPSPEAPPTATKDSFDFSADLDDFKPTSTPAPPRSKRYEVEEDVTSTSSSSHVRRYSSASSNFPAPPPEMTMLMQEDHDSQGYSSTSSYEPGSPTIGVPLSKRPAHRRDASITSISPTTANFSMMSGGTGSPRSLCLRPEHEQHLGDMDSLDLGHRSDDGEEENEDW